MSLNFIVGDYMNEIIVDTSEPPKIKNLFIKEGIKHKVEKCPIGDFVCNDVCIERKSIADFAGSMKGHLQKQLLQMQENFKHPYLIISGSLKDLYATGQMIGMKTGRNPYKGWTVNHHVGSLASIGVRYNVQVLQVDNDTQLVKLVAKIVEKSFDGKVPTYLDTELVSQRDKMGIEDTKLLMIMSIPKIGLDKAKVLRDKLNIRFTTKDGDEVTLDFLKKLDGFGPVLTDKILEVC